MNTAHPFMLMYSFFFHGGNIGQACLRHTSYTPLRYGTLYHFATLRVRSAACEER